MKMIIDLQSCQTLSRKRGIGRYSLALAKAIVRNAGNHEIWLLLNNNLPDTVEPIKEAFADLISSECMFVFTAAGPVAECDAANEWRARTAELVRECTIADLKPDIVLLSSLFEGFVDDAVTSIKPIGSITPTAVVLYDLIPFLDTDIYRSNPAALKWYHNKIESLKRADLLLAISASAAKEAETGLAIPVERIVTIYSAANQIFQTSRLSIHKCRAVQTKYGINRAFVLYTGTCEQRKNVEGLILAYSLLPRDVWKSHQLLLACQANRHERRKLYELAASRGLSNRNLIILSSHIPDEELVALYILCKLFVFPSFHEGFGLPVLEAMACGAAVIGSNTSSVPEVIGREDALFNPREPANIAALMRRTLSDGVFRQSLKEHGQARAQMFSWDATARKALDACERIVAKSNAQNAKGQAALHTERMRLAMITPLPPEKTGVADYSAELLINLNIHFDIVLITDQENVSLPLSLVHLKVRTVKWFELHFSEFDHVVYQFGSSPFHAHMFNLLQNHPGVVVLHDFFLGGLVSRIDTVQKQKYYFLRTLYESHGYEALVYDRDKGREASINRYPCNYAVLERAIGVIVPSDNAANAAMTWYGGALPKDWRRITRLRALPVLTYREAVRKSLGFKVDDFVVCSFGFIGPAKCNHRLLSAWEISVLAKDTHCRLLFVGENSESDYGIELARRIEISPVAERIKIIGYVNRKVYQEFIVAADMAVQLLSLSQNEDSCTILDVLTHGVPLVINANESMTGYPDTILAKLPKDFSDNELVGALESLRGDAAMRQTLSYSGRAWVAKHHQPRCIAEQYRDAIKHFYSDRSRATYQALLRNFAKQRRDAAEADLIATASAIAANQLLAKEPRIFVDISNLVIKNYWTGIERVNQAIARELLFHPPEGWRIEPVYFDITKMKYRYARSFALRILDLSADALHEDIVETYKGEIFLVLDLGLDIMPIARPWFEAQHRRGVKISFIVYDILPLQHPEWFPYNFSPKFAKWMESIASVSDNLIGISRVVTDAMQSWISVNNIAHRRALSYSSFHLGADLENSHSSRGLPKNAPKMLSLFMQRPSFLLVSTIEPRKGHSQTVKAFEQLWAEGLDSNLVIVGKQGWKVEKLTKKLRDHAEKGKRLFWLQGISDEYLEKIYLASTALIAASEGEGFGLPLTEAARHKLPIIARDMPVFKEVAGEHAYYFSGTSASELAKAIREWVELWRLNEAPKSERMPWLTWKQSTKELLDVLLTK